MIGMDFTLLPESPSTSNCLGHARIVFMIRGGEKGRQEDDVICALEVPVYQIRLVMFQTKNNREQQRARVITYSPAAMEFPRFKIKAFGLEGDSV